MVDNVLLFDAVVRACAAALAIRGLCVMNRMSWRKWSLFTVPVLLLVMAAGYVVLVGAAHKAITYPLIIFAITLLCLLDKRRTTARRDKK